VWMILSAIVSIVLVVGLTEIMIRCYYSRYITEIKEKLDQMETE